MEKKARRVGEAASKICQDLQATLSGMRVVLPELKVHKADDGNVSINLGKVGVGTALRLTKILKLARKRRHRSGIASDGWAIGGLLGLAVCFILFLVVLAATGGQV